MNWMHLNDLLGRQIEKEFPNGDVRPFAAEIRRAKDWAAIEKLLRADEKERRIKIEDAIAKFIARGTWPKHMTDKDRMWLNARLSFARALTLRLAVPVLPSGNMLQADGTDEDVLLWLLLMQWNVLGVDAWIADLHRCQLAKGRSDSSGDSPRGGIAGSDGPCGFAA